MTVKIAIIGSGPSGMYAMDGANKYMPECQVDIIDRLPTPYGLIRAGVAPDHLGTKNVIHQYEKAIAKGDVKYFGNIEIGKDISINNLRELYDAVIIATGAAQDRKLAIPGEELKGVYGSAEFVGWYNGHPDYANLAPDMSGKSAIIIGNGNVSLDIARLMAKTPAERRDTDLPEGAADIFDKSNFSDVHVVGRRGPLQTSFTPPELRELGRLDNAIPVIDDRLLSDTAQLDIDDTTAHGRIIKKDQDIFHSFTELKADNAKTKVHLQFLASPVEIIGKDHVTSVKFEKNILKGGRAVGTGAYFEIDADIVITAIGYKSRPIPGIAYDDKKGFFPNVDGHISDNIYVVGWGKRGPSGTIPVNRPDSFAVAKLIAEKVKPTDKAGRQGLNKIFVGNTIKTTNFDDWKILDQIEIKRAIPPKAREKIVTIDEMLELISST